MSYNPAAPFQIGQWVNAPIDHYDLIKTYEEEVAPLMLAVETKCQELGIPFVFRACIAISPEGNTASMIRSLAGVERATPDMLAMVLLDNFTAEYIMSLTALMRAAQEKYGTGEQGILVP